VLVRAVERHLPTWLRVILIGVPRSPSYRPLPSAENTSTPSRES